MIEDFVNDVLLPSIRRLTLAERRQMREEVMRFYHPGDDALLQWLRAGKPRASEDDVKKVLQLLREKPMPTCPQGHHMVAQIDNGRWNWRCYPCLDEQVDSLAFFLLGTDRDISSGLDAFGWADDDGYLSKNVLRRLKRCRACKTWTTARDVPHQCSQQATEWALRHTITPSDRVFLAACGTAWDTDAKEELKRFILAALPKARRPMQLSFVWGESNGRKI